jgi:hypothetical protein
MFSEQRNHGSESIYEAIFGRQPASQERNIGQTHENGYRTFVYAEGIKGASIEPLRRLLSMFLLAVFGFGFVSPLLALTAKSESNLPAGCRRNGQHHCMISVGERAQLAVGFAHLDLCSNRVARLCSS